MKKILTISKFTPVELSSTDALADLLGVDAGDLKECVLYAETKYTPIKIFKKNGVDYRTIHAPDSQLKSVQKAILINVLSNIALPECSYGHGPKKSIVDNARFHLNNNYLLTLNLKTHPLLVKAIIWYPNNTRT